MGSSRSLLLLSFLLLSLLFLIVEAAPQATPTNPSLTAAAQPSTPTQQCGFAGDDNTYGLGIRIGLYLQWFTSSIAYNFVPEEAVNMRGVNTCFQLANFAGLLYITIMNGNGQPSGQLFAVEVWIVLIFCLGGVCSGRSYETDESNENQTNFAGYKASALGGLIQIALVATMTFYAVWFVYIGMDHMAATPCSRFAFFFAKVVRAVSLLCPVMGAHLRITQDLFHWFRTFVKVAVTISAVTVGLTIFVLIGQFFLCLHSNTLYQTFATCFTAELGPPENPEMPNSRPTTRLGSISLSFSLVFFIVSTELIIKWNHISGVNKLGSTGQLLPFIAALASLIRVFYKFFAMLIKGEYGAHLASA